MAMSQQPTPPVNKYTGSYTEDADGDVRLNAFGHEDTDIVFDPLGSWDLFLRVPEAIRDGILRQYGMEWFGSLAFFDGRRQASQAIWMDLALARRSGQELRNAYVITKSPEHAPLRRFFKAAVDQL